MYPVIPRSLRRPNGGTCFYLGCPILSRAFRERVGEEGEKFPHHRLRQLLAVGLLQQAMCGALDWNQFRGRRNQLDRALQFRDRAKRVARATNEENGSPQAGEMRGSQLRRASRRM